MVAFASSHSTDSRKSRLFIVSGPEGRVAAATRSRHLMHPLLVFARTEQWGLRVAAATRPALRFGRATRASQQGVAVHSTPSLAMSRKSDTLRQFSGGGSWHS